MFYLTGIIVTLFLSAILISKKGKTEADWILFFWLVTLGLHLTAYYLFITGKIYSFPHLLGLEFQFPLLHGPFLYLYTEAVTNQVGNRKFRIFHFAPFIVLHLFFLPFVLSPPEHKLYVYQNNGLGYEILTGVNLTAIIVSGIAYVVFSLRLLVKHRRAINNQFSYAEKINLAWLRYLIYGIAVIWVLVIIGNDSAIYSTAVVFVIVLGYFGIKQVGIFTQRMPIERPLAQEPGGTESLTRDEPVLAVPAESLYTIEPLSVEEPRKAKYLRSSLDSTSAENIHNVLTLLMNEQKPYKNPELTLADLAQALNVNRNNLSQVINTFEQKSFYDYINLMRVEEFKRIVSFPESQKFTLLGLANDCGFNSKTSFNRNFKSVTGFSPTEYLKQVNILLEQ